MQILLEFVFQRVFCKNIQDNYFQQCFANNNFQKKKKNYEKSLKKSFLRGSVSGVAGWVWGNFVCGNLFTFN
jgi:hypothetical protein